ncbi:unnamed protein product [Scytosiphon promiscuus]
MTWLTFVLPILLSAAAAQASPDEPPSPPVWPGRFHAMITQVRDEDYGAVDLWYDYAAGRNLNIIVTQSGEEDGPLYDNERANGTTYYYNPAKAKAKYCNVVDFGVGIIRPDWLQDATFLGEEQCGIYQCNKWEQGEIPQAHARFLGLRPAGIDSSSHLSRKSAATRASAQKERSHDTAAAEMEAGSLSASPSAATGRGTVAAEARKLGGVSLRGGEGVESGAAEQGEGDRFITYWSQIGTDRPVKWLFFDGAAFEVVAFDEGATMPDEEFQIPAYCFADEAE